MTRRLEQRLERLARAAMLLVASDFDGTLAPIVPDPDQARAIPGALAALDALSRRPATSVALISGRSLADLSRLTGECPAAILIGSHGAEWQVERPLLLSPQQRDLLARVRTLAAGVSTQYPGTRLESKPAGLALHYRLAEENVGMAAVEQLVAAAEALPGLHLRHGKKVVEISVTRTDKGAALRELRQRLHADAVLFLGDDLTDEDAFALLEETDVGVKVGEGESRAGYRVRDPREVADLLAQVARQRAGPPIL